ncbi:MAG: alpha/beta hydrolase [Motiliproteus sp.]
MMLIKTLAAVALSAYLLMGLVLFVFQRDFLYFPTAKQPHRLLIEPFSNQGERIEVVVLNPGNDDAILYFGGNAESVILGAPRLAKALTEHTLYLVNYRGYGGSSGSPTEQALYSDAQSIYDAIKNRHAEVSVVGRSLGSGIATLLASTRAVSKLVLITPFDSIQRIAQDRFPLYPMALLLKDRYNSVDRIQTIESKTLIILAEHDEVIPLKYSARLIDAFQEQQISVKIIAGTGHNSLSNGDEYYALLQHFIE